MGRVWTAGESVALNPHGVFYPFRSRPGCAPERGKKTAKQCEPLAAALFVPKQAVRPRRRARALFAYLGSGRAVASGELGEVSIREMAAANIPEVLSGC